MFAGRGSHGPAPDEEGGATTTLYPRSPDSDWREIAIRADNKEDAERLAKRVEEGGYSGVFFVSPARASARLVDGWGQVFLVGHWPREPSGGESPAGTAAG